ncbi:cardiolipin synthase [Seongchinamella sediminis]|uniref:Cardiolipin synthase n=1 Tax=Seongchinamella sediminis TaxID=2283635 RepID=A0A3L7E1J4_9GAMM|nr:cardiolipin synthase [Seongchinamella sediminis]RLQ23777.1 cardiolipin synthase [Seongchinamella sediminis]
MEIPLLGELIAAGLVLLYLGAIACAVEAILKGRTPQGAIAWALSLLTFPMLTMPFYLIFSRNRFDGYLEQRDEMETHSRRLLSATSDRIEDHVVPRIAGQPVYTSLFNLARMPATRGNKLRLLIDGTATFDDIRAGLESAETYILFQFYIIRDDDLSRQLCRILADKARAGVTVALLYDEIGSRSFHRSRLRRQLLLAGVEAAPFNTTQGRRNRFQLNFRNHRKVVVVDGSVAWIGGHNVGNEYLGLDRKVGHWRDTHVRFEGPAVLGAELAFATDWLWATRQQLKIPWNFSRAARGDSTVLVFPSDPASEYEEAGLMYHQSIVGAEHRVWIASPYFVPDRGIVAALQLAALRGVDVRVIIPDEPDGPMVAMANWSFTRELLASGIKFYRYQGGFMHQKVLLMDDQLAGIGTANFDNRSFRLNFEITVLAHDQVFAREVEAMLERDMGRSRQVGLDEFATRPAWFIVAMAIARLFAPVL